MEILGAQVSSTLQILQAAGTATSENVGWFSGALIWLLGVLLAIAVLSLIIKGFVFFFHFIAGLFSRATDPSGYPAGTYGSSERDYARRHHLSPSMTGPRHDVPYEM